MIRKINSGIIEKTKWMCKCADMVYTRNKTTLKKVNHVYKPWKPKKLRNTLAEEEVSDDSDYDDDANEEHEYGVFIVSSNINIYTFFLFMW